LGAGDPGRRGTCLRSGSPVLARQNEPGCQSRDARARECDPGIFTFRKSSGVSPHVAPCFTTYGSTVLVDAAQLAEEHPPGTY
jgi:hypothetical protein